MFSMEWLPSGASESHDREMNNSNNLNLLRTPTGRRQTSWLCISTAKRFNYRLPQSKNPADDKRFKSAKPRQFSHARCLLKSVQLCYNIFYGISFTFCSYNDNLTSTGTPSCSHMKNNDHCFMALWLS